MKIRRQVTVFSRTTHKSNQWMKDVSAELPWLNGDQCYHLFRAVIQSLRDRMTIDEGAQFSAQLPLLLRGTFYEGWNPRLEPSSGTQFADDVRHRLGSNVELHYDLDSAIKAILQVITNHLSQGEVADIYKAMPRDIKDFFPSEVSARAG